jgi:hypothetical protein
MTITVVLIILAVIVERAIELLLKIFPFIDKKKIAEVDIQLVMALALGELVAFGAGIDLFEIAGIEFMLPYVGCAFAGFFIAGGSTGVHELLQLISKAKESFKTE